MRYILSLDDPRAEDPALSGGKGASLSRWLRAGLPVPPGLVVTPAAYRAFIAAAGDISGAAEKLPTDDPAALAVAAAGFRARLGELPLPADLAEEIAAALGPRAREAWAVRSSSGLEDLHAAAFAGQHDSFLNCVGLDAILDAVKKCFLSLWHDRAIAYRRRRGFAETDAVMRVVIQNLVDCRAAGVAFTLDPVTGRGDEIVIAANYGLGESVVGGEGETDQYHIDKKTLALRSVTIGLKTQYVVRAEAGTTTIPVSPERQQSAVLQESEIAEIAALARRIEEMTGLAQDIEWGLAGASLWLLQARPVTVIPPRWTRDESAERFPNVMTPLAWDFMEAGFHEALAHSFALMGLPPFSGKWFALFDNYVYGDQNAVARYMGAPPVAPRSLGELRAALPVIRDKFAWIQSLPRQWSANLDRYLLGIGELMGEPLEGRSPAELWDHVQRVNRLGRDYFRANIAISIGQSGLHKALFGLLEACLGAAQAPAAFAALTGAVDTKTTVINDELAALAAMARDDAALVRLLRQEAPERLTRPGGLEAHPAFAERFAAFLADHGHREVDPDPYHPVWAETPHLVLGMVKLMLDNPASETPDARRYQRKQRALDAELALMAALPADLRLVLHEVIRLARLYTELDDLEHYQTARLLRPMRRGLDALGASLVAKGGIDQPSDIFFAREAALSSAIARDEACVWHDLRQGIAANKRAYELSRQQAPAWTLGGAEERADLSNTLTGVPGSPGLAEGPVFIVHSPEDFAAFPRGAVLVARTTNPAWTVLFPLAAAVVTESGGALSHGAVTAREAGIPAVMAVRGVMQRLVGGMRVQVDGARGHVAVL